MTTKKIIADQLLSYMQHHISLAELTAWAEQAIMSGEYDDDKNHTVRNILAHLGAADVKAFGLEWQDCENIMNQLGFKLEVKALKVA